MIKTTTIRWQNNPATTVPKSKTDDLLIQAANKLESKNYKQTPNHILIADHNSDTKTIGNIINIHKYLFILQPLSQSNRPSLHFDIPYGRRYF